MDVSLSADLIKQGVDAFGNEGNFLIWLEKKNFFFNKKAPIEFINTAKGIKFIEDKLAAMTVGDNI